ncbi:hypothetical protein BXZ70DRAFT_80529 [Cristinia sonorae]|uniref:PepSY domain-containing protein n=1 Tax=Cristinia sonorae TaxID=1940300 RepID=A0A8K0XQZ1_9AGAR|nr:hypothetical protein BXZ70DRAFT_80529 [Cristinia sonorae]
MVRIASALVFALLSAASGLVAAAPLQPRYPTLPDYDFKGTSVTYVQEKWGVPAESLVFDEIVRFGWENGAIVRQTANGKPLWNSYGLVKYDKDNKIISLEEHRFDITSTEPEVASVDINAAIASVSKTLNSSANPEDVPELGYIGLGNVAKYVYRVHLFRNNGGALVVAYISASTGQVLLLHHENSDPWWSI